VSAPSVKRPRCALCDGAGGEVLWEDAALRVVAADESDYPGFCRVIWQAHVAEFTDLDAASRARIMEAVAGVEQAVRATMRPDKINVASLGNQVPHLHWHVIPRFVDDPHFPAPVWASRVREAGGGTALRRERARALAAQVAARLGGSPAT
jgi:diadenosine tetraphosphate (Ap4A) HIT family hydrolase